MWPLIDQLVQQGVADFFLASGSRSTPLVLAAARHPKARIYRHFDERALGFYAMGCALGKEAPVAILITSGTAVANLMPAVMEASLASIPLLLLTADRPSELRDTSANQTTDQIKLFENLVRWQFDFDPTMPEAATRSKAAHAVFRARAPHPGPVQLNCPLREPLYPLQEGKEGKPISLILSHSAPLPPKTLPPRGLVLIGALPKRADITAVLALAHQLQWPVFADIRSNARLHPTHEQIRHYDWIFDPPKPDCILHFGERLTSKRLMEWLSIGKPHYIHISPHNHWFDPFHLLSERIVSEIGATRFQNTPDPDWLPRWKELDSAAQERLASVEAAGTETEIFRELSTLPLDPYAIFLGASMPIREGDWFLFPKRAKAFFSNRGASGIDGNIATAVGLAEGLQSPVLAIIGDLTALHDLNAFALVRASKQPIVLLISNNYGGGIFSHLPIAKAPRFEELFAFAHEFEFKSAAQMFGLPYETDLKTALQAKRSCVVELINRREENARYHQQLREACLLAPV